MRVCVCVLIRVAWEKLNVFELRPTSNIITNFTDKTMASPWKIHLAKY